MSATRWTMLLTVVLGASSFVGSKSVAGSTILSDCYRQSPDDELLSGARSRAVPMPSTALTMWTNDRLPRLNAYDAECVAKFAIAPPPALADEMLRGYVMLLSANLQGFCRDLYTECLTIVTVNAGTLPMMGFIEAMGSAGLELNRVNPKWKSIRADFDRFGFDVGQALTAAAAAPGGVTKATHQLRLQHIAALNEWRNYAAHALTNPPIGGPLALATVTAWKNSCDGLATQLDGALYDQVLSLTGSPPW